MDMKNANHMKEVAAIFGKKLGEIFYVEDGGFRGCVWFTKDGLMYGETFQPRFAKETMMDLLLGKATICGEGNDEA